MRKTKVEGEYQPDSWPKGPETSLCPLARPDIAMGFESQIEAWSARRPRRFTILGSHRQYASRVRRTTTVSKSETTGHHIRGDHLAERRGGLGRQVQRHRDGERYTLDIPLHRRDLGGGFDDIATANLTEIMKSCLIEIEGRESPRKSWSQSGLLSGNRGIHCVPGMFPRGPKPAPTEISRRPQFFRGRNFGRDSHRPGEKRRRQGL